MTQPLKFLLLIFLYLLFSAGIVLFVNSDFIVSGLIILTGLFLSIVLLENIRFLSQKIEKRTKNIMQESTAIYYQIESLFSIYSSLNIDNILPPFRGWAISPDFASLILSKMKEIKPVNILECGSGISTLLIAYYLKKTNKGHLFSLEHDKEYADSTAELLVRHGLEKYVTLVSAQLVEYTINKKDWKWYDLYQLNQDIKFDLVMIDGPPFQVQPKSRYPALPLLDNYINQGAIILIDDCSRTQDNEVVNDWLKEFDNYDSKWFNTEKGAYILTKQS